MAIKVKIINQLEDNYSYVIFCDEEKKAVILDPAEPKPILDFLLSKNLSLKGILITHHHSDHTQGIETIIKKFNVKVYSPNTNIVFTTDLIDQKKNIDLGFLDFEIIHTPGHTLDHVIYYNKKEKLLFSGDTLFFYGCGRVFEGTYEQMLKSLKKIKSLPNDIKIYCGHEYTYKNLEFIFDELLDWQDQESVKQKTKEMIKKTGSSMPFDLGHQKDWNPFLNYENLDYKKSVANFDKNKGKISPDATELEFFTFIRDKRNKF